ncbi:MAG TPA: hypothetical protein VHM23_29865 [Actinomycetota bacterium]|nr:hypothetical protein [Actinomycetota bacterium]
MVTRHLTATGFPPASGIGGLATAAALQLRGVQIRDGGVEAYGPLRDPGF